MESFDRRRGSSSHPAGWAYIGLSLLDLSNITNLFGVPIQYRVLGMREDYLQLE